MERNAAEVEAEAEEIGLLPAQPNWTSQQVNAPTIPKTITDVSGSTSDPVKESGVPLNGSRAEAGVEAEEKGLLPSQLDGTFKRSPTAKIHKQVRRFKRGRKQTLVPQANFSLSNTSELMLGGREQTLRSQQQHTGSAAEIYPRFKDSLKDDQTENDTCISNNDTTGHERDELKEADLETKNKWVGFWLKLIDCISPMEIWCKLTAYCPWNSKRRQDELGSNLRSQQQHIGSFYRYDVNQYDDDDDDDDIKTLPLMGEDSIITGYYEVGSESLVGSAETHEWFELVLSDDTALSFVQPNPGIRRPPVTVLQPPPPPPPTL